MEVFKKDEILDLKLIHLRIKIWFFGVHQVIKPVGGAKIPYEAQSALLVEF